MKRQLEKSWKSLSSSVDSDPVVVNVAEEAFKEQSKVVDNLFSQLKSIRHTACSVGGIATVKRFWAAVSGKVKEAATISAGLSSSGVLK